MAVSRATPGEQCMADLAPLRTDRHITAVEHESRGVGVTWDDGWRSFFHVLWLRDNCACPQCRHPQALERTFMFIDAPAPVIRTAMRADDGALEVEFGEGESTHRSRFAKGWLRAHDSCAAQQRPEAIQLWDERLRERLVTIDYEDYMGSDTALREWIQALNAYGIVLLRGVPQVPGKLLDVATRIGPVRESNFGKHYDVISMARPNASAYTDMGLELHTDLVNWRFPPDVQMLFCLKSSVKGGESIFADGFMVAEALRACDPETFELLSTQLFDYRFHDERCDIRTQAPALETDRQGRLKRIRFNNWLRAATVLPEDRVEPVYAALRTLWRMLREPKYRLCIALRPGNLIAFDNNRVLHGRRSFDASSGERHLQGCYLNQEAIDSALRLLERRQG